MVASMPFEAALQPAGVLTLGDIVRYSYFHYLRRAWLLVLLLMVMFVISIFGIVVVLLSGDSDTWVNPGVFWCVGLSWSTFAALAPYFSAKRLRAKLQYFREPMHYSFREDRIRLEGTGFSGELAWSLVHSIDETKTSFVIYHSSQIAWLLPKRFFSGGSDELTQWREFAIAHLSSPKRFHHPGLIGRRF